jgi:hypothetical protein
MSKLSLPTGVMWCGGVACKTGMSRSFSLLLLPAHISCFLPFCVFLSFNQSQKADSYISCRAHAVPLPYRAAKGLECVFPIWFTQCGLAWFTLVMPRPCHALPMPFFSRPRQSTAVDRRPVGYLPAFGFFRLSRGVPRKFLSEAYQSSSQRSIPTTVKSGSNTLQKRRPVKLLDQQFEYFRLARGLSRRTRHCRSRAGARHGMCELTHGMAGERHGRGMGTACYVWIRLKPLTVSHFSLVTTL